MLHIQNHAVIRTEGTVVTSREQLRRLFQFGELFLAVINQFHGAHLNALITVMDRSGNKTRCKVIDLGPMKLNYNKNRYDRIIRVKLL